MIKLYRTILFVIVLLMLSGCDNVNEVTKDTSIESSVCKDEKNITDTAKFNESFFDDRAYEDWILYDGEIYDPKHDCGTGLIGYDTRSHIKHLLIEDIHCTGIITLPNGIYFMTEKGIWEIQKDKIELIISHTTGGYSINNGYILNKDDGQTYYDLPSKEEFTINTENNIISGYVDEDNLYYTTEKELRVYNLKTRKDKLINTGIYTIIGMEKENIYLINNEKLTVVDVENGMNSTYEIEEGPYDDYHIREGKLYAMRFVDDTEENDNGKIIKYDIDEGKISYRTNIHRMTNGFYNYDNIYIMTPDIKTIEYDILNMIDVKKAKRPSKNDFFFIYNKFINDYTLQKYLIVHDGYTDKVGKSFLTMDMNIYIRNKELLFLNHNNKLMGINEQKSILKSIDEAVYDYDYDNKTIVYTDKTNRSIHIIDRATGKKEKIVDDACYNIKLRDNRVFYCKEKDDFNLYCYDNGKNNIVYNAANFEYDVLGDYLYIIDVDIVGEHLVKKNLYNDECTTIEENVCHVKRIDSKIYYVTNKKGISGTDGKTKINVLYCLENGVDKKFIKIIPMGCIDKYFTYKDYQYFYNKYDMNVMEIGNTTSEMVDKEDIIYEDDNTIVFKMLISGIEYWNESIVVLYNKKKDDIEVVIRDIEPEVWQQDLFQLKLIDEWIYFYDQRYGGDEESRIIGISRINVDTYEIQKIAPVQGNRIDYIANDNYVVIHDRFDRNGDNNEYIKIYSMVNKKGIKIAELDDGIVNAYEGKKSLGCIRDKYLYYTNGDYNLVKVNLENIKERSTIVEDIDKILGDIYLGNNNIFYIDADGYISMYNGSKPKKISKLKVRSGIFHWNDFQGTVDPGLPGYSYKKYNQCLYQHNFIYYVSENDHLMTINLEDLFNEKLANDCKYVLEDTGVKNNSLYYVGNNKKLYELDVISKERDSIEEIYKDEIYYYRNSLIFITKYQNKIIRRNFKTRYLESLGNVYLLEKIKYIKDNVVFYEDTNGDADILLMDTFK
ncbi:hypothetical protein [Vallitalea guaymasensis]|uniref:hypothetical protein n=1 Tax=Vallitalea guaymasensis TaxID=1185412 RepID=UPI00235739A2|nr:hypothetical protein [Vallitalea guaymasensis]